MHDILLEALIAHEQVELVYQPMIDAQTSDLVSVEALVRSPLATSAERLFSRARSARLDERLSRLIQRKVLRSAALWEGPLKSIGISINLLPADISRPGYENWLMEEAETAGIDCSRITLEITESSLLAEREMVAERLDILRAAGFRIAVDDFGTGYASLDYLTSLPLDFLKIDRGLVQHAAARKRDRIVVEALIRLARDLGLKSIAEGVETPDQLALLRDLGCDYYQGFLGSPPLSHEELIAFAAEISLQAA